MPGAELQLLDTLQLAPAKQILQVALQRRGKEDLKIKPAKQRLELTLQNLELTLGSRAKEDRSLLLRRVMAEPGGSDNTLEDRTPCTEAVSKTRYIRKWDSCRFLFQRRLPLARRPGRQIELYDDTLSGQTVAAKRMPWEQVKPRLEALRAAGSSRSDAEGAWPEVVLTQRLGRALRSPGDGICTCHGAFRDERGDVLLVTEYLPGGDLFDLAAGLGQPGPERERQAWPVILSLLRAVLRLHARGVAHGDVSLENALRRPGPQGEVVLIDFEMAVPGGRRLKTGVSGKPSYQAPEMWASLPWDTFAADLFACGVAAYCLAVGGYPWDGTRPGACRRFAYFSEHGLRDFLQRHRVPSGGADMPVAKCLSERLTMLLDVLLSPKPALRRAATAFVP